MNEKRVVVDASIAIKWVVSERGTEAALGMLDCWAKEDVRISVPCLMFVEASNALYKRVRREELTIAQAVALLECLMGLGVDVMDTTVLHPRAMELAGRFGLPATYDAYYLSLAEALRCELWTADERLFNTVKHELDVRWLVTPS